MILKRIQKLSIKKRNLFGFLSITLLLLIIAFTSLISISILSRNNQLLYEKPYMINEHVWRITNGYDTLEKEMYKMVATHSSEAILQTTADMLASIHELTSLLEEDSLYGTSLTHLASFIEPLTNFEQKLIRFANGELSIAFDSDRTDEIGHLGKCLTRCAQQLHTYIDHISSSLSHLANGDLTFQSDTAYVGDFIPIHHSLSHLQTTLAHMMGQVHTSTNHVSDSAVIALDNAEQLEQLALIHKRITTDVVAQIGKLAINITQNKTSAEELEQHALSSIQALAAGKTVTTEIFEAMQAINFSVQQITAIILSIDNIAKRSHLLSLNASIESARLGDTGSGFKVIAREMQALSLASSTAAKETSTLLSNCLDATQRANTLSSDATQTMYKILQQVEATQALIGSISKTSLKQYSRLQDMRTNIKHLKDHAYDLTTFASSSTHLATTLTSEAQELHAELSTFIHITI